MTERTKIILVEDNPDFLRGAEAYFSGREDVSVVYCHDFVSAPSAAALETYQAGIFDCFMPYEKGNPRIDSGLDVLDEIAASDEAESRARSLLREMGDAVGNDSEARKLLKAYVRSNNDRDGLVLSALSQVFGISPEVAAHAVKNTLGPIYGNFVDHYEVLEEMMRDDPSNQPMGIALGDEADAVGMPFVLATSTHHHGEGTQAIADYASRRGWTLVDCDHGEEKESPEFWERAYAALRQRIESRQ